MTDASLEPGASRAQRTIGLIVSAVRRHLKMDVAFVSQFRRHDRVIEHVDSESEHAPLRPGQVIALSDGYCRKIVDGELPAVMPDTREVPAAQAIPATAAVPVGSHIGLPIWLSNGQLYGTFCCFGYHDRKTLSERDLHFMQTFVELIADELEQDIAINAQRRAHGERIAQALADGAPHVVFQPIFNIKRGRIEGFECLSRFATPVSDADPANNWQTEQWFREAHEAGLGAELEIAAIRQGLGHLGEFGPNTYLSVNCSANTILSGRLHAVLADYPGQRVIVELTEHDSVSDYPALLEAIAPLRDAGIRIAVDDAGAGYSSMRHVLQLAPDKIKLDLSLTRGVDSDSKKRALVAALCAFGRESGASIVAEGVEQPPESLALAKLGVDCLQGFLIGPPLSLQAALRLNATGTAEL